MDRYFELKNGNNVVVVDDTYAVGKFLIKKDISAGTTAFNPNVKVDGNVWAYTTTPNIVLAEFATLREGGFDYDDTDDNLQIVKSRLFVFSRSAEAHRATCTIAKNTSTNKYEIRVGCNCDTQNLDVTVCLYTFAKLLPSKLGLLVFNASGELVFDALKGHLQQVATMSGGVDVRANPAATYNFSVPAGLLADHLFLSNYSTRPSFAAYNITSGGVSYASTFFNPVITQTSTTSIRIDLVRQRDVAGSNSSVEFSNIYENIIYCPYPKDIYTGFN